MRGSASLIRYLSPIVLGALLGIMFWLAPDLTPQKLGAETPDQAVVLMGGFFVIFWIYLQIQGYPISHGDIGTASSHTIDNIMSFIPGLVALFGLALTMFNFWELSQLNIALAVMTLGIVWIDLWIFGGSASKINRLTDEIKSER
jgi:hypothetical protein